MMYVIPNVHKQLVDGFPKIRPILSAINTPTYKVAKFLVKITEPLNKNEFAVKDTFLFAQEIRTKDSEVWMSLFDVDSLSTDIPLDESIDICCNELFKSTNELPVLTQKQFRSLF